MEQAPPVTGHGSAATEPSSLDSALLESLFYNEMIMMDSAPHGYNLIEAVSSNTGAPAEAAVPTDSKDVAEHALLRDFGVTEPPLPAPNCYESKPPHHQHVQQPPPPAPGVPPLTPQWVTPLSIPDTGQADHMVVQTQPQTQLLGIQQTETPVATTATTTIQVVHVPIQPRPPTAVNGMGLQPPVQPVQLAHTIQPIQPIHHHTQSVQSTALNIQQTSHSAIATAAYSATTSPLLESTSSMPPLVEANADQRAELLVQQFATLASRLGIELPAHTLQSLTAAASLNEQDETGSEVVPFDSTSPLGPAGSSPVSQSNLDTKPPALLPPLDISEASSSFLPINRSVPFGPSGVSHMATGLTEYAGQNHYQQQQQQAQHVATATTVPTVEEVRRTAEAAIEAASRKRDVPIDFDRAHATNGEMVSAAQRAMYSKRKKKPRLSDCEMKLAELKAENERLKRHLQTVSNKANKFDQDKNAAGDRIKSLLNSEANSDEMKKAIQEFTEMYSDYGQQRQHELDFHLEQLQGLVNPTNFTKMGLWTLAQGNPNPKHNPIAGILQKELAITPQQGKKIIYQREKVRNVCDNLKECLQLLGNLKALCAQKTRLFNDRMKKCQEILTAKQVVKLIMWINDNTQVLDSVCPGWGTEHIPSKK